MLPLHIIVLVHMVTKPYNLLKKCDSKRHQNESILCFLVGYGVWGCPQPWEGSWVPSSTHQDIQDEAL